MKPRSSLNRSAFSRRFGASKNTVVQTLPGKRVRRTVVSLRVIEQRDSVEHIGTRLISGDIDFAPDFSRLSHWKKRSVTALS